MRNIFHRHVVCAVMTDELLSITKARGNDLIFPRPQFNFLELNQGYRSHLFAVRLENQYIID